MLTFVRRSCMGLATVFALQASTAVIADERPKIDSRIFECSYLYAQHPGMGVIMVLGDSNITNGEMPPVTGLPNVFNVNPINGLCYPAHEPMMGTIAKNGSPWVRLGNALVNEKIYTELMLVPVLLEGSTLADWQTEGRIYPRVKKALTALESQKITINAVVWQFGQKYENQIKSADEYKNAVTSIVTSLRGLGLSAPVYVAKTGDCVGKNSGLIYEAQGSLPGSMPGVVAGADVAKIEGEGIDSANCALTDKGVDAYVKQWTELLRPQ